MGLEVKEENGFRYVEEGQGPVLLLLHGLFGALSNWEGVVSGFSEKLPGNYSDVAHLRNAHS